MVPAMLIREKPPMKNVYRDRLLRNLKRRAAELGFQLTTITSGAGEAAVI
jgi:hypothetical protein